MFLAHVTHTSLNVILAWSIAEIEEWLEYTVEFWKKFNRTEEN